MKRAAIHARAMKRKAEMLKLRNRPYFLTVRQIADKHGISPTRVMQIIGRTKRGMEQVTK